YPFINCTSCGPRYTIVRDVPYDRPRTTMAAFTLCAACRAEYEDPADRRFHAEPNACPVCGPSLAFGALAGEAALAGAGAAVGVGQIGAVKGLGGYHLACIPEVARRLRARKHRPHKPLALMARSPSVVESVVHVSGVARAALLAPARPIVLLPGAMD